jgi:hypothetical protein
MSEETNTPPAPAADASADALAAIQSQLVAAAETILADVPEHLRGLIPASLSPADQIAWFQQAKATGVFAKPIVPPTDGGVKPVITPAIKDPSSLPVYARIAGGYRR